MNSIVTVKDHKVEDEKSGSNAISGEAINARVIERDSEQEEIYCRVCDPVDEDIEADAEKESEIQHTQACQRDVKCSNTTSPTCHRDRGALTV